MSSFVCYLLTNGMIYSNKSSHTAKTDEKQEEEEEEEEAGANRIIGLKGKEIFSKPTLYDSVFYAILSS